MGLKFKRGQWVVWWGVCAPAGLCMKDFFFSSLVVFLSPPPPMPPLLFSRALAWQFPRVPKRAFQFEARATRKKLAVCSPECFAKLHRDPPDKEKGKRRPVILVPGILLFLFFVVVVVANGSN